ncbi:unnamed protein product [Camellia sinensis]
MRRRPSLGWDGVRSPAVAMQTGIGLFKILILVGAGNCGREGHRRYYCPELQDSLTDRRFKCRLCEEKGHNKRICPKTKPTQSQAKVPRHHCCRICVGHTLAGYA